jgi:hypothetical protein
MVEANDFFFAAVENEIGAKLFVAKIVYLSK